MSIEGKRTEMKVVILCVSKRDEGGDHVDNGYRLDQHFHLERLNDSRAVDILTSSGWLVAKIPRLIPSQQSRGLYLRCWASRELLVEADDPLHTRSILSGSDPLSEGPH